MKLAIRVSGADLLRQRMTALSELAGSDRLVRKGMSDAARIVSRAQKNLAPVRKGRVQMRQLDKRLKKGMAIGKATRLSSVPVVKRRAKTGDIIKPGLLKRSIGFRVKKEKGTNSYSVVIGANVGKKRSNPNNAPHAAFVGSGTKQRYAFRPKAGTIGPRKANRGIMPPNYYISNALRFAAPAALKALEAGVQAEIAVVASR